MSGLELLVVSVGLPAGYWLVNFLLRGGRTDSGGPAKDASSGGSAWAAGLESDQDGARSRQEQEHPPGGEQPGHREEAQRGAAAWHQVLDVEPCATTDDIRSAYRRQLGQYHPDKVAALGPALRELATHKSQEITAAYREAMRSRGEEA